MLFVLTAARENSAMVSSRTLLSRTQSKGELCFTITYVGNRLVNQYDFIEIKLHINQLKGGGTIKSRLKGLFLISSSSGSTNFDSE